MLLLPYLEQQKLYDEFRLGEPWDSPHNLRLLDRMPSTYKAPWTKYVNVPPNHTVLKVFVGPGTAFEPPCGSRSYAGPAALVGPAARSEFHRGLRLKQDFPDGPSDTLLYVEAGDPVPWTKPDDIPVDPERPVSLRGLFRDGCRSGTVDGTNYRFIRNDTDWPTLRAAITRNGGEPGPWDAGAR